MLNIVCVKWGTLYSSDYVNILYDMVRRNIKDGAPGKFVCFTDNPDGLHDDIEARPLPDNLTAWWNKLYLFKDGLFPDGDRVVYLDLDTVITGSLDDILGYNGEFAILRDFYRQEGYQSSIMSWVAGTCNDIWNEYVRAEFPSVDGGDQAWIEKSRFFLDIWQDLFPDSFVSYKAHCSEGIPRGAKVVIFHGVPMPHQVLDGWVPHIWKIGGGSSLEMTVEGNTQLEVIKQNIRSALDSGLDVLTEPTPAHDRHAVIVGGGPSIKDFAAELRMRSDTGQDIVALNNSWRWLEKNGITVNKHVMLDAREENAEFIPHGLQMQRLYASQCHPKVIESAPELLWHALIPDIVDDFNDKNMFWVGSGTTVGIRSILLLYVLGYRHFHIYGYDSSYLEEEGHAYPQVLNNGEKVIDVQASGRAFKAAPWMVTQTNEFLELMEFLTERSCEITIHGDGLLQHAVKTMLVPAECGNQQGDVTEYNGIWWPTACKRARQYSDMTAGDIDSIMKMVAGRDVVVQAGGNVGVWPKAFAKEFKAVYTFEPDYTNFRCLNLNCTESNIIKIQAALGERSGFVGLERQANNCGAHSVSGVGIIPTLRIDDLGLTACDLIQLDIEGYELNALKGAIQTITTFHPLIVVEDKGLSDKYGTIEGDIAYWLIEIGYGECARLHRDVVFCYKN